MPSINMSAQSGSARLAWQASGGKLIIANWKMNLTIDKALGFIKALNKASKNKVVLAAPFTFLKSLQKVAQAKGVHLAGQNVSQFEAGAYTGEISAGMLKAVGCRYCLVGHSERRLYFQETDQQINQKIKNLLAHNIAPIVCVGENAAQRQAGLTKKVLKSQLLGALKDVQNVKLIIAYEPVWAISTFQTGKITKSAQISDIIEAHNFIRKLMVAFKGEYKILYGGTVKPQNAHEILEIKPVDGALVGGASLKVSSFNDIISNT